jgi:hypothetical protein
VGGLNSLGQPNSARKANFQELENETCPGIFCWILESGWNSWGSLLFLSFHQLWIPPDSSDETPQNSSHFQGPSKPFNFNSQIPSQPPKKLPKISRNFQPKNRVEKFALTIGYFHDSSRQKRAIRDFRFVVNFSSREFKIGCQVLFLTSCITLKIPDKNSRFSRSSQPRNENERKHSPASSFQRIFFKGKVLFVRLSFSASGLRWVEHKVIQNLDQNPVLDGKLFEQLEMKMLSSWPPQKNFHHFFLLSVREVLAVDKK